MNQSRVTAATRYRELDRFRRPALDRAREMAKLSIPSLMPPEGFNYSQRLYQPYQDVMPRLNTNLASRLTTAFLPPGQPAFRLGVDPAILMQNGTDTLPPDVELGLTKTEKIIMGEINRLNWRDGTNTAALHLLICGNVLEQMLPDNSVRHYRLDQYVVVRDPAGRMIELIVCEALDRETLPDDLKAMSVPKAPYQSKQADTKANTVELYTWAKWDLKAGVWHVQQELGDEIIQSSVGDFKKLPFNALMWAFVIGEHYGRSKMEEHSGGAMSIEALSKALIDGSAMASRNITLVRPNAAGGINLRRRLAQANNGEVVVANPDDVEPLEFKNSAGMQFVAQHLQTLVQEMSKSFVALSAAQRQAERVTAFEFRKMVEELEGALGGVYSRLSGEWMGWRIERLMTQLAAQKKIPDGLIGRTQPTILTGLEALGREAEVARVSTAFQFVQGIPPEITQAYIKWSELLTKAFNGLQLPDSVRSDAEAQQIMQQQAAMKAAQAAAPQLAKAAGDAVNQQGA